MTNCAKYIYLSYKSLIFGCLSSVIIFSTHLSSKHENFSFHIIECCLYLVVPFITFSLILIVLCKWPGRQYIARAAFFSSIALFGAGLLLYSRVYFVPPVDPKEPDLFEPNLIFIFGAIYQTAVALMLGFFCFVWGVYRKIVVTIQLRGET